MFWLPFKKISILLATRLYFSFFQINIKKKKNIPSKLKYIFIQLFSFVSFENNLSYCPYRIFIWNQFFFSPYSLYSLFTQFSFAQFLLFFFNQSTVQIKNYTCISNSYDPWYYKTIPIFLISTLITRLYYFQQITKYKRYLKF